MRSLCEKCGGTGFVSRENKSVELCECRFNKEDINRILRIPKRFWKADLENYQCENDSEVEAFKESIIYASNFDPSEGRGLTFVGPPGVGKTHLAVGVLKKIYREKGVRGIFFDTKDLIYRLKALIEDGRTAKAIRKILEAPLLVLDDLGSERLSEWQRELISYIISHRYNSLKSTIITTNFSLTGEERKDRRIRKLAEGIELPKALMSERLGPSTVSRIFEMSKVIYVKGRDRRRV